MTIPSILRSSALAIFIASTTIVASALSYSDANLVGTYGAKFSPGTEEDTIAQHLLDMTANAVDGFYKTGTNEFSGTLGESNKDESGNTQVGAGWEFVMAKYGNYGILFYLGGNAFTLPSSSSPIFINTKSPEQPGFGLSHFTTYNRVPDAASTAGLLALGLGSLGLMARRRKA